MSERAPYSRVYWSIVDDPKFVGIYDDDHHMATWLRLLIAADALWPASCPIPGNARKASVAALVKAGLIDLGTGHRFRVHGLDAERGRRRDAARSGTKRGPSGDHTVPERVQRPGPKPRRDETSLAEQDAPDPWDDPEGDAVTWLARHGCALLPHSGYYRNLVTMVETHGVNAVVGMFDRLADAGTKHGDVKGYVFGAKDALDSRTRPSLTALAATDRAEERDDDLQRRLARTRVQTAELRAALAGPEAAS
jgi:hypothetical protein